MNLGEQKKSFWSSWFGIFLGLSIAFHIGLLIAHFSPFGDRSMSFEDKRPIEITEITPEQLRQLEPPNAPQPPKKVPQRKEQEIAESEESKNKELDPNARFLSDKNQTAEKQTRAKMVDDFRKQEGKGPKGKSETVEPPPTGEEMVDKSKPSDLEVGDSQAIVPDAKNKGVKRDWKKLTLKDLGVGGDGGSLSASDDRLNGVDEGERTILSTREFKFFSYYHRIKELLRQHWKPNVERKLTRMIEKGRSVSETEMVTRLQVMLSPDGKISKISRVLSSGIEEIDEAAIEAFNRAGPFPNPPKGMLDADGFVRINWDFILKTEASPRIQFSNAGRPIP